MKTNKKQKLLKILKKLGDTSDTQLEVIFNEIEKLRNEIPEETNLSPFFQSINVLQGEQSSFSQALTRITTLLSETENQLNQELKKSEENSKKTFEKLKNDLGEIQLRVLELGSRGGGSKPLQIQSNGVVANTRYADINLVAGSGVTLTTANDDTKRITTITIASQSSGAVVTTSSTIDDSNTVFVFSGAPSIVCINGAFYQPTGGAITWTGTTTITLSSPVGINGSIWGLR
jgi:gas vesicle protein